jgi:hypothetical protein
MLTRSKTQPTIKKLLPGETLRPEPRSDDESDSDADERGNLRDFVVYEKSSEKPVDHEKIDREFNAWTPRTKGQQRLKNVIQKYSK